MQDLELAALVQLGVDQGCVLAQLHVEGGGRDCGRAIEVAHLQGAARSQAGVLAQAQRTGAQVNGQVGAAAQAAQGVQVQGLSCRGQVDTLVGLKPAQLNRQAARRLALQAQVDLGRAAAIDDAHLGGAGIAAAATLELNVAEASLAVDQGNGTGTAAATAHQLDAGGLARAVALAGCPHNNGAHHSSG